MRFDAEDNKKPVGITLKADHLGYYFEPVYEHKHDDIKFEAWDSNNSFPDTQGNYYLTKNVHLSSTWNVPGDISMINLCLNNHTIYMENNGDVIQINSGCHLNLFDDGSGTITHANSNGRGVYISGGHFGMYGGTISGNNVLNGNGGGVCIENNGDFYMGSGESRKGSAVENNRAENGYGGGVYAGGTFLYRAGKVDGNAAIVGTSDKASNVYLPKEKKIVLRYGGTVHSVGVSMEEPGVFTQKDGNMDGVIEWFTSDDDRYYVDYEGVELALRCKMHDFKYTLESVDTIKAECKVCGLTGTLQILRPLHIKVNDSESPEAIILAVNIPQGDAKVQYFKAKGEGDEAQKDADALQAAPIDAGQYWAEITLGTDGNSATAHVVYTILKDDSQVVAPSAQATYGQKLGEVALENPEGNVEGDWEWVDDTLDVGVVGEHIYKANFMPEDQETYKPVLNVDVRVTAVQAENPMEYVDKQTVKKVYSLSLQRAAGRTAHNITACTI